MEEFNTYWSNKDHAKKIKSQIEAKDYYAVFDTIRELGTNKLIEEIFRYILSYSNVRIFNIWLEQLGLTFLINKEKAERIRSIVPQFTLATIEWVSNRLDLFINTLARLLHQRGCGLIVMTYICYHRHKEIIDIIDDDPTDPGRITMIMKICYRASITRPVDRTVKLSLVKTLQA